MASNATQWKFKTSHAQSLDILNDTTKELENFVSAESVVLVAGPAVKPTSLTATYPIGLCDSVGVQQNRNIIQLFEVGSKLPYLLPGRTFIQLQLNRVLFNGDNILGALTKGLLPTEDDTTTYIGTSATNDAPGLNPTQLQGVASDPKAGGNFFLNLAASFFNKSFGLGILIQDSDKNNADTGGEQSGQWVSAFYAENCMIQTHNMNIQGQQYVVMESASVRCTNLQPWDVV